MLKWLRWVVNKVIIFEMSDMVKKMKGNERFLKSYKEVSIPCWNIQVEKFIKFYFGRDK